MKKQTRLRLAALGAALCLALTGCTGDPEPEITPTATPAESSTPTAEQTNFVLACYPEAGFHPITGSNRTNLNLAGLMYEGLFALDQQFEVQQVLCSGYTTSEDALTWTFTLRSGVTFSDGSALTSAEVVSSLESARTSTLYSARFTDIGAITAGEGTVTIVLTRANGSLPALLDIPIVKETGGIPLGTGPYVLTGTGEERSLTANGSWWQGESLPLDTIPLRAIQEADDLIHAFDTKEISLVATDLTATNALGFSGSYDTVDYPTSTMVYVGFNTVSGPCRDAGVRRALLRAFDRDSVSTALYSRHAQPAALPVSPASSLYKESLAEELSYSSQGVADALTGAGWTRTDSGWVSGRETLSLELVVSAENQDRVAVAQHLVNGLNDLGINATLTKLDWDSYVSALQKGDFDLYLGEVRLTGDFDLTALITSGGSLNYGGYSDAEAAARLQSYRAATGQARDLSAQRLYERLAEEPPFAVLCFKNWSVLTQWNTVSGLTPTQQNVFYQFAWWKIGPQEETE